MGPAAQLLTSDSNPAAWGLLSDELFFALVRSSPGFAEPVSSFTHLVGAGVFLLLTVVILRRAWGSTASVVGLSVFGLCCVFLLSMSGVYHLLSPSAGRDVLQQLDFAGVFALVAGTFTPVHAILFQGRARWLPLMLIWAAAITGMTVRILFSESVPPVLVTGSFLVLGWAGLATGFALWRRAGYACIRPLFLGGLAYTAGAVVFAVPWLSPVPGFIEAHEVWHMFVLLGLAFHWRFVARLAPRPPEAYLAHPGPREQRHRSTYPDKFSAGDPLRPGGMPRRRRSEQVALGTDMKT